MLMNTRTKHLPSDGFCPCFLLSASSVGMKSSVLKPLSVDFSGVSLACGGLAGASTEAVGATFVAVARLATLEPAGCDGLDWTSWFNVRATQATTLRPKNR